MMMLLGLKDDYSHDGRALTEDLSGWAIPSAVKKGGGFATLAPVYKQIEAPVGPFGLDTLAASTHALESGSSGDDSTYTTTENELIALGNERDALAQQMIGQIEGAEFKTEPISQQQAETLTAQAQTLLNEAQALAGS
jgi:hypothetical protein